MCENNISFAALIFYSQSVTAPKLLLETTAAYLASTPRV
jgi:hypothetical protein